MSDYSKNATSGIPGQVIDYERQYQEDLERAQALSLESLALEKFKLRKQQNQYGDVGGSSQSSEESQEGRVASVNEK